MPNTVLTPRELDVFEAMQSGDSIKATAAKLGISPKTVDTYRARIRMKLGVQSTAELLRKAMVSGEGG